MTREALQEELHAKDHKIKQLVNGNKGVEKDRERVYQQNKTLREQIEKLQIDLRHEQGRVDIKAKDRELQRLKKENAHN